jgi:hypothetical protein
MASKFACSWPPSASRNSLDYSVQTCSLLASKCISTLHQFRHPNASPNSLNHDGSMHLKVHSIGVSQYISNMFHYPAQVQLETGAIMLSKCIPQSSGVRPPTVFPNMLNYKLQVHLQTCSITILECNPQLTLSRPPSLSPKILDYHP